MFVLAVCMFDPAVCVASAESAMSPSNSPAKGIFFGPALFYL